MKDNIIRICDTIPARVNLKARTGESSVFVSLEVYHRFEPPTILAFICLNRS